MGSVRRQFSREFKVEAVRLVTEGGRAAEQVARELGVRSDMIRRWRRELEASGETSFPGSGRLPAPDEELRRLRRELAQVREEREILKKALAIFSDRPR